ncbi:MAG: dTDP-4-dehydrorhamnose reductase [Sphingobacteriia bacterium]|nr:dTDP-4-dehydrorhamnose reductase [Sphingobacteriia bacterium]
MLSNNNTIVLGKNGNLAKSLQALNGNFTYIGHDQINLLDINNIQKNLSIYNPKIIINTSAFRKVDLAETCKEEANVLNHLAVKEIAKYCEENDATLIHISTDYVFDGKSQIPYVETDPVNPINIYGISKLKGEEAIQNNLKKHIIIRSSWFFNAIQGCQNYFFLMLNFMKKDKEFKAINDQLGNPTYTPELAKAICKIINKLDNYGIYHYSGKDYVTWLEVANKIHEFAIKNNVELKCNKIIPISTKDMNQTAIRPLFTALNCSKIEQDYEIQTVPFTNSLNECFKKYITENV